MESNLKVYIDCINQRKLLCVLVCVQVLHYISVLLAGSFAILVQTSGMTDLRSLEIYV